MKNIKLKILFSFVVFTALTSIANAAMVPGVALVVAPASLNETIGNTFDTVVVVKTLGDKVYAVEGTVTFDGLSCQNITITEGLMAQSVPTCSKPYFLIGIPSGTAVDKAVLRVSVKTVRLGDATLGLSAVDVIGAGISLSNAGTGAVYSIAKNVIPVDTSEEEIAPAIERPKTPTKNDDVTLESIEQARSIPATQLAAVADFVTTRNAIFLVLSLFVLVLVFRHIRNRYV